MSHDFDNIPPNTIYPDPYTQQESPTPMPYEQSGQAGAGYDNPHNEIEQDEVGQDLHEVEQDFYENDPPADTEPYATPANTDDTDNEQVSKTLPPHEQNFITQVIAYCQLSPKNAESFEHLYQDIQKNHTALEYTKLHSILLTYKREHKLSVVDKRYLKQAITDHHQYLELLARQAERIEQAKQFQAEQEQLLNDCFMAIGKAWMENERYSSQPYYQLFLMIINEKVSPMQAGVLGVDIYDEDGYRYYTYAYDGKQAIMRKNLQTGETDYLNVDDSPTND